MSSSALPPAPASSPPEFSKQMVGRLVKLFLRFPEGRILDVERQEEQEGQEEQEDQEPQVTVITLRAPGATFSNKKVLVETRGGTKFQGILELVDKYNSVGRISVRDDEVTYCRCCTNAIPTPPFSRGMAVRFSETDPRTIEATVLQVQKQPTLSFVVLEMTTLPPYSASIGETIMLRSGMETWEATVMSFGDEKDLSFGDVKDVLFGNVENIICIHVLDKHVPRGPKCLPPTRIVVRPALEAPPRIFNLGGKGPNRKHKCEENEANQKKIKVALNDYRDMGRALARVAIDSEDVELVAINDTSITDQVSCMFRDSKCDFEVKSNDPAILSFGKKEVRFFEERDPSAVLWHMVSTNLVVTSSICSQTEQNDWKTYASKYSKISDIKISGPLEKMLGSCNSFSTTPNTSTFPVLQIKPISLRDAKAVSDCFPLWKGKQVASVVRFQGIDVIFELTEYQQYALLLNSTKPTIDLRRVIRWCFDMLSRTPAAICDVRIS